MESRNTVDKFMALMGVSMEAVHLDTTKPKNLIISIFGTKVIAILACVASVLIGAMLFLGGWFDFGDGGIINKAGAVLWIILCLGHLYCLLYGKDGVIRFWKS